MARPKSEVACLFCNKKFMKENREIKRSVDCSNGKHFCSKRCSSKHAREQDNGEYTYFTALIGNCKKRAKCKGIACDITKEDLVNIAKKQRGLCAITGIPMYFPCDSHTPRNLLKVSVDRINADEGYVVKNIQLTTTGANYMRNEVSMDDAMKFVSLIRES